MSFVTGTCLLAVVTAITCALPGVFVVLRKNSMLVDAIGHAVLPGIVIGYYFTRDLDSPFLVLGAALAGLIVVLGSEYLSRTGLLAGDSPQGLVFPALFSFGVILISLNFANIHLDTHVVLVGDFNLVAFIPMVVGGVSIGPSYLYFMAAVGIINAVFIAIFYSHLKITTFDTEFASTIGVRTGAVNTAFMFLVSFTVTAAFNAAGAILIVALIVVPPATAYLLTDRLEVMIGLTVLIAAGGALAGFWIAFHLNAATSAGMSVFYGILFALVLVIQRIRRKVDRNRVAAAHAGPMAEADEPALALQ